MRIEKIIVFLALFAAFSAAVFAATVTHPAENIRAGIFGNTYAGNWSFMNGSVGIGTTSPAATLQVNSSNADGAFAVYNRSGSSLFFVNGSNGGVGIGTTDTSGKKLYVSGDIYATSDIYGATFQDSANGIYRLDPANTGNSLIVAGNVGIGTTTPTEKLNINGSLRVDNSSGSAVLFVNSTSGRVGIGTTSPNSLLQVGVSSGTNEVNLSGVLYVNSTSGRVGIGTMVIDGSGKVGIGVADPVSNLVLPNASSLAWKHAGSSGSEITGISSISSVLTLTTNGLTRMVIDTSGNVGIGTTTPSEKLSVNGNLSVATLEAAATTHVCRNSINNVLTTCSADISEYAPNKDAEAGDVVIISEPYKGQVVREYDPFSMAKSTTPYDTKVIGVIGDSKEASLGEKAQDSDMPLVIAGRVPVKATAENGAIKPGDLLTTSSKPGYAMKCNDKVKCIGAIVGKALEPLDSGSGKIIALVTLQ